MSQVLYNIANNIEKVLDLPGVVVVVVVVYS